MPADHTEDDAAPTALRAWSALLAGVLIAGVGLCFLIIGHSLPVLSALQLAVGCWMVIDGVRGLLRRHPPTGRKPGNSGAEGPHG